MPPLHSAAFLSMNNNMRTRGSSREAPRHGRHQRDSSHNSSTTDRSSSSGFLLDSSFDFQLQVPARVFKVTSEHVNDESSVTSLNSSSPDARASSLLASDFLKGCSDMSSTCSPLCNDKTDFHGQLSDEKNQTGGGVLNYFSFFFGKKKQEAETFSKADGQLHSSYPEQLFNDVPAEVLYLTTIGIQRELLQRQLSDFLFAVIHEPLLPGLLSIDECELSNYLHGGGHSISKEGMSLPFTVDNCDSRTVKVELSADLLNLSGTLLRQLLRRTKIDNDVDFRLFMKRFSNLCLQYRNQNPFLRQSTLSNSTLLTSSFQQSEYSIQLPMPSITISSDIPILCLGVYFTVSEGTVVPLTLDEGASSVPPAVLQSVMREVSQSDCASAISNLSQSTISKILSELSQELTNSISSAFDTDFLTD